MQSKSFLNSILAATLLAGASLAAPAGVAQKQCDSKHTKAKN